MGVVGLCRLALIGFANFDGVVWMGAGFVAFWVLLVFTFIIVVDNELEVLICIICYGWLFI